MNIYWRRECEMQLESDMDEWRIDLQSVGHWEGRIISISLEYGV